MNGDRRKQLEKATSLLSEAKQILEEVHTEEEESFDNLSEGLQATERGQTMQANVEALFAAMDYTEDAINHIAEVE
jgi:DNA-directed RNA polymerase subunit F